MMTACGYADDNFRAKFLWGRERLIQVSSARLEDRSDLVWVDLGGGTAENVQFMSKYINLKKFSKIYVVDLCSSLCKVAAEKARKNGWTNVEVVEGDACSFQLPGGTKADLVTFSYSLSSESLPTSLPWCYCGFSSFSLPGAHPIPYYIVT
jgi:betaine lipid synthase